MISESGAVQEYCQAYNLQFSSNERYRILVPNIFSPTEYDMFTICSISAAVGVKLTVTLIFITRFTIFRRSVSKPTLKLIFEVEANFCGMHDMRGSRIVCAHRQVLKNTSDYLKMNQDELVLKDAQISIISSAHEQKSKHEDHAQTRSVKNLHELVTEM